MAHSLFICRLFLQHTYRMSMQLTAIALANVEMPVRTQGL
jgi:hypothetical protein